MVAPIKPASEASPSSVFASTAAPTAAAPTGAALLVNENLRTCSAKQRRANRRNARLSTGPRTAGGKRRVAQNAVSHGVFAQALLLPGEDPLAFCDIREGLVDAVRPQDALELLLVDQMFAAQWKTLRLQRSEQLLHAMKREQSRQASARCVQRLRDKYGVDTLAELESRADLEDPEDLSVRDRYVAASRELSAPPGTLPLATESSMAGMLNAHPRRPQPLERASRYEQRLNSQFHRALRDLVAVRSAATKQGWQDLPRSGFAGSSLRMLDEALRARADGDALRVADAQAVRDAEARDDEDDRGGRGGDEFDRDEFDREEFDREEFGSGGSGGEARRGRSIAAQLDAWILGDDLDDMPQRIAAGAAGGAAGAAAETAAAVPAQNKPISAESLASAAEFSTYEVAGGACRAEGSPQPHAPLPRGASATANDTSPASNAVPTDPPDLS